MSARTRQDLLCDLVAPSLLLLLPLLIFIRHGGYDLWRVEVLACCGLFLAAGLLLGLLILRLRTAGRVLIVTGLMCYVLDMQVTDLRIPVCIAATIGFGAFAWAVRRHLTRIVALVTGAMLLATLAVPAGRQVTHTGALSAEPSGHPDLPFILHIILDEQIGIEGIPAEFDPDGRFAAGLRDFFLDNGFEVYGRAYSRYFATEQSIPNLLNFHASSDPSRHFSAPFRTGLTLKDNAWFERLERQGYRLHVIQSDFLHYLDPARRAGDRSPHSSVSYTLETIHPLQDTPLPAWDRTRFIIGIYSRLSDIWCWTVTHYSELRVRLHARGIRLPIWRETYTRTSSLAALDMCAQLRQDLRCAGPGLMMFAHLMLPHAPYAYTADGRLRPRGRDWQLNFNQTQAPRRNDAASRAATYPQYLDQVAMTRHELAGIFAALRATGQWDNAIIVVHGDHGSRLCLEWPFTASRRRLSDTDLVDGYATLFAIRRPGRPGRYDRRLLPLDHLFTKLLRDGEDPGDPGLESRPGVFLANWDQPMTVIAMPDFGRSLPPPVR